jgi:alkanesulfonate monooxygenase SsuD/methylene tetrahydromethanopterin reductase-like flavin-dependent oxidoreductase (luciferase family)
VDALRITDDSEDAAVLDPSVAAAYLAGSGAGLGLLVEAPTTANAPYNLARRLLSLDRATGGRAGLVLRPGQGDAVSGLTTPDPAARDPRERWAEYARILIALWESFPAQALRGDKEAGIFAEENLISPIHHDGRYYRVAGPLDGPASRQGRPVLAAADVEALGWDAVARVADVVLVNADQAATANARLTETLAAAGRRRDEVRLLGRAVVLIGDEPPPATAGRSDPFQARHRAEPVIERMQHWADSSGLDGLDITVPGGAAEVATVLREVVPALKGPDRNRATLRAAIGLPVLAGSH